MLILRPPSVLSLTIFGHPKFDHIEMCSRTVAKTEDLSLYIWPCLSNMTLDLMWPGHVGPTVLLRLSFLLFPMAVKFSAVVKDAFARYLSRYLQLQNFCARCLLLL